MYDKKAFTIEQQIEQLTERGLIITKTDNIAHFLSHISYYRLAGYLPSWLQSIAQIRNYCAHHARLWNRNLPGSPKLMGNPPNAWIKSVPKAHEFQFLYVHLCCMKYLLNVVQPENTFTPRLAALFVKYPNVDPNALGMKHDWHSEDLWQ